MKNNIITFLRWTERFTKTDMVYLASSGFWINLSTVVVSGISFILSIGFANLVSKETFGIYQFVVSIGTILSAFTLTGMNAFITKIVAQGKENVLLSSIKPQLFFNIFAGLFGVGISTYYIFKGNNIYALMVFIISLTVPLITTYNSYTAFLNGKRDFKKLFIVNTCLALFYSAGMVIVILLDALPLSLIVVYAATNTIGTIACFRYTIKNYNLSSIENIDFRFAKKLSFSNIPSSLLLSVDSIVIYHLLGPSTLALYAIATQLPERAISFLRSITTAAIPKFSTYPPKQMREIIFGKTSKMLGIALIGAMVYTLVAQTVFTYVFPKYISVVTTSYLAAIASAFAVTGSFVLSALIATHEGKKVFIVNVVYPIISIICIVIGAIVAGINGAIIGKALGSIGAITIGLTAISYAPSQPQKEAHQ
jgi:O-antigen/teichoic acid export membrane protein